MDLFGDLPDPVKKSDNSDQPKEVASLFDELPPAISKHEAVREEQGNKRKADGDGEAASKRQAKGMYGLYGHFAERRGERDDMQDAHVIITDFKSLVADSDPSVERLSFFAVYDGHGGARAAQYAAQHLHMTIATNFPKGNIKVVENEIKKCLSDTMKKVDDDFLKLAAKNKPVWKDGTTAMCVLVINNTLYIANLGDSKAVLCRHNESINKLSAIPLSKDHSPTNYEERMRIQRAGGHVKDGRVMGVIEVSRSIGDGPYKRLGLTCIPDVKRCQLTDNDRYIIIACDGLWKAFDNSSAIEFISHTLEDEGSDEEKWDTACGKLASEAVRKLSADNVTVVIVRINRP